METEKDPVKADDKRVYRSPQLTAFGSVANVTRVNEDAARNDNPASQEMTSGLGNPPGNPIS